MEEVETEGRKFELEVIRQLTVKKHQKFMRSKPPVYYVTLSEEFICDRLKQLNEYKTSRSIEDNRKLLQTLETTRNFQLWHDASVIANHGHIVMTVNVLYDEAIFYSSEEYYEISNEKLHIHSIIEEPYLYIIGRCRANDEQIMYVETRLKCLRILDKRIDLTNFRGAIAEMHILGKHGACWE